MAEVRCYGEVQAREQEDSICVCAAAARVYPHKTAGSWRYSFLDGNENDAERLPITSNALQYVFETYNISHRFAFFLSMQRMAGASMHYETDSTQPRRLGESNTLENGSRSACERLTHSLKSSGTPPSFAARRSIHPTALERS